MKTKLDVANIAVSLSVIGIGLFFLYNSMSIDEEFSGDGLGPRFVPQITAVLVILFALFLVFKDFYLASKEPSQPLHNGGQFSLGTRLLPLIILAFSFFYVLMFYWFGYLLGTLICAVPIYFIFGNRKTISLVILPLIFIAILYTLFFGVMKLFDMPGQLIDTTRFFRW
jgi:hypothetical protein